MISPNRARATAVCIGCGFAAASFFTGAASAQTNAAPGSFDSDSPLLSIDQLINIQVTSVGRKAEPWFYVPASIEVLTEENLRRYGSLSLPDTLRIVPGIHVARSYGNSYSVTSRGFSSSVANKMLVLMDGRSLYTPLFSGVFWEVQDTLMLDLDRIEVVRGPGATLWGANAVNGVINITSKDASQTQGTLLQAGGGNEELGFGAVRYGAKAGENTYWRVYSKYRYRDEQVFSSGIDAEDFSEHWQTGFRADSFLRDVHQLTFQGDFYLNESGSLARDDAHSLGGNVLGRWTRRFSEESELQAQLYYDRADRDIPLQYKELRNTVDAELQHRFQVGERNDIVWGANYRVSEDQTGIGTYRFDPTERTIQIFTGFIQDEIAVVPDRLALTVGTKIERNDFTGFEWQPSARLAYTPTLNQTVWGAISRAVRTPTRIEADVRFSPSVTGTPLVIRGNEDFKSEDLVAYELGYRVRPWSRFTFEISGFCNVYDDLRTLEPTAAGPVTPMNEREGETYGIETTARYQVTDSWRLTAGYTFLEEDLRFKAESRDPTGGSIESNDPEQMAVVRSRLSLPYRVEFDQVVRYVDQLPNPHVPGYVELDLRLAWRPRPGVELSLVGMNLLDSAHPEFSGGSALQIEVERSIYGRVVWLF